MCACCWVGEQLWCTLKPTITSRQALGAEPCQAPATPGHPGLQSVERRQHIYTRHPTNPCPCCCPGAARAPDLGRPPAVLRLHPHPEHSPPGSPPHRPSNRSLAMNPARVLRLSAVVAYRATFTPEMHQMDRTMAAPNLSCRTTWSSGGRTTLLEPGPGAGSCCSGAAMLAGVPSGCAFLNIVRPKAARCAAWCQSAAPGQRR